MEHASMDPAGSCSDTTLSRRGRGHRPAATLALECSMRWLRRTHVGVAE